MIEIKAIPGKLIMLGKQGENLAREVVFDVSGVRAEFGDGAFRLSAKRPGEADAYPATVTETGDTVVWALTGADTQNAGRGQCELAYYAGETRLKTWTYDVAIAKSLTGSPKTDPYDEFLDEVNRLAAEAAISQREAKNSENAAKNSEENAKASEGAAKTSEDNAAAYAQTALTAEKKSEQNAENAASAAVSAGQYAQNAAVSATSAANSATAAENHEKAAKDAATAAAKSAEGLADAVKRAEDAATAAQDNAGKTVADREAVAEMKTAAETAQDNAEKSATAAAGSATAAETSRTGAAEIKAQIDEIKAEIDQAKADIDQTKTDTLAAKTAAETAATTATEKAAEIADSAAQIATNTENIETNATDIDLLRRENVELKAKTDALWKLSEGKSYDFVEDSTEAYSKDVPTGCRFAQVEKIGGKTVARNAGELVSAGVEDVEVRGANLLDPKKTTAYGDKPYGLTITMIGENTFRVSGVPSSQVTSAGDYSFSVANNSQEELRGRGLKVTAFPIKGTVNRAWGLEPTNKGKLAISAPLVPEVDTDIEFRLMVSAATPSAYHPYSLDTYPIPDAVKALPGYGWSAGNVCNEIVRRADGWDYIQRVGLPATTDGYTALAAPITTDITDLMTGALPLMTTEPGGTITMHHALADDGLTVDVPNTIKYIRDLKEVASSESE